MGTKPRQKGPGAGDPADPGGDKVEGKKPKHKKRLWLVRILRKRKRRSDSEECLCEPADIQVAVKMSREEPQLEIVMEPSPLDERPHDIMIETTSSSSQDKDDEVGESDNAKGNKDDKNIFSSAINFLKYSFRTKRRRSQNDYAKFCESNENITESHPSTSSLAVETEEVGAKPDSRKSKTKKDKTKGKKNKSKKYVLFADDKENAMKENRMGMDDERPAEDQPSSTTTPKKKKKKSARKRVAKASKKTGRMFGVGMIQVGRNLQYLSPMPTPHVFQDTSRKSSSYSSSSGTSSRPKPKKPNYKYTASAPPSNPYTFI